MTAVSPVISYEQAFVWHIAPFLIANQLAIMLLFWGIPAFAGASNHLSNFSLSLRALWAVATNQRIDFPVTPKSGASRWGWTLAWPQLSMVVLSVAALCVALARVATCAGHGYSFGGLLVNGFWGCFNVCMLCGRVRAALWRPATEVSGE
jgi:cellulose synthase (UDP-forming)